MKIKSKILIIAGSDSSGGAGIQADIKTVTSLGSYAMTAFTAITSPFMLLLHTFLLLLNSYKEILTAANRILRPVLKYPLEIRIRYSTKGHEY